MRPIHVAWLRGLAGLAVAIGLSAAAGAQTLVGDTVEWWRHPQLTGVATLDSFAIVTTPAHEFEAAIPQPFEVLSTLNVEATSIRLSSATDWFSPYFNSGFDPTYYEIRDLDFVGEPMRYISGVSVTIVGAVVPEEFAPMNWPAFSAANVTFTGHSVRFSIGGYEFPQGSYVHVDLQTAVPGPTTAGLMGIGALAAMRRRRR